MKILRSKDNTLFKDLQRLAGSSRERRQRGLALLEGERLIDAYVRTGKIPEVLIASEAAIRRDAIRNAFDNTRARQHVVLDDSLLERISQVVSASGLIAVVETPETPSLPISVGDCLLLENIQDPGNLGSILRTAAAANVRQVFLSRGCVFAWSPKVVRAGMGAHFSLDIYEGIDLFEIITRATGTVVATLAATDRTIDTCDLKGPIAWMFGNEGAGLSPEMIAAATLTLTIPMPGTAESLNVAAAAAVCLFEQVRQRRMTHGPPSRRVAPV